MSGIANPPRLLTKEEADTYIKGFADRGVTIEARVSTLPDYPPVGERKYVLVIPSSPEHTT